MPEPKRRHGRMGAGRRRERLRARRALADGGVPDQEFARACGPARSSAVTGSSGGCSARTSRRRRPTYPSCPTTRPSSATVTLREALARHRADKNCAGCHERFDAIGLAYEGYGPVGEFRTKDLGGRPVDTRATFPGGGEGTGLDGLRAYLDERRADEFIDNLCRKLLAYALGRSLLPSDDETIDGMRTRLAADGDRFGSLVESIVTSPQFRNRRVDNQQAEGSRP